MLDSNLTFVISSMTPWEVAEVMLRLLSSEPKDTAAAAVILCLATEVAKSGKPPQGTPEDKIARMEALLRRTRTLVENDDELLAAIDAELAA